MMSSGNGHLARDKGSHFEHTGGRMATTHSPVLDCYQSVVPVIKRPAEARKATLCCTDSQHAQVSANY
jgi:hypothetical protein